MTAPPDGVGLSAASAAGLPVLMVYAGKPATRTVLHLQPGFATVIRADRPIDTVAVGDPRIVSATPVHRGADVFDVVLQPETDTGTTNMVLWAGDATTVWDLQVGPGPRTADVVFVVSRPGAPSPAVPPPAAVAHRPTAPATHVPGAPGRQGTPPPAPGPRPSRDAVSAPSPPPTNTDPAAAVTLRQTEGPVSAVFRAFRTQNGILLRYEITNSGDADLTIKPATILIRADGRPAAYGMLRNSVDRGRPDVIPRGATETGAIDIAMPGARRIELVLSLLPAEPHAPEAGTSGTAAAPPAARAGTAPSAPVPIVLDGSFSGLDRLPLSAAP